MIHATTLQNIGARLRHRNKLGFAMQMCVLRYPARLLASGDFVLPDVVNFIGCHGDFAGDEHADYADRLETGKEIDANTLAAELTDAPAFRRS